MAAETSVLVRTEPTGVLYALPTKPDMTIRFRNTKSAKTLNGVNTQNYLTEIIYNDNNPVTISGVAANDAVSIRLRVSGAFESHARLAQILSNLSAQVNTWVGQNVLKGFQPTSAPTIGA